MRFSWIALPLVFASLVGVAGASSAPAPSAKTAPELPRVAPPLVALPSPEGVPKLEWLAAERRMRAGQPPDTEIDVPGESAARDARLLGLTIDRAELDFSPELRRAVNGFLSSCTTSCPPPLNH